MTEQDFLKLQNGSDIRGIAIDGVAGEPVNLTDSAAFSIGQAFAKWLSSKIGKNPRELTIGIGRDSRLSGEKLCEALAKGLNSAGTSVVNCGMATTPAMFMSIVFKETSFDGSVMVTASHLPFNRNGLKFFIQDGGLEHKDITEILTAACKIDGNLAEKTDSSQTKTFTLIDLYSNYLRKKIISELGGNEKPLTGLKIVVDAGNGAGGFFAEKILLPLGADITGSQFLNPDGNFPNHIPNPENKTAMAAIKSAAVKNNADLGLIFDTDVDRMSAVLSNGDEVNRDALIAIMAAILAPDYPQSTIITDSVTSDRLTHFLEQELKLKHLRYMRGYKNVINKCKELNKKGITAPLAIETSGHGALKDNFYLDDGAFLAVKLVSALAKTKSSGKKLESLIEKLPPLIEEGEYRFKIKTENFKEYGTQVLNEFKARAEKKHCTLPKTYEGVRISFKDKKLNGWILLRMSLHDPVMPMNIESETKGGLKQLEAFAEELLADFDKLDISSLKN